MLTTAATPWDCLLRQPALRLVPRTDTDEPTSRPGTKLSRLLDVLAERGSCTTLTLSAGTDLESRQVWGLLKTPRTIGQVEFSGGRWSLVQGFAGRDVERAAALLRDLGWRVEPPTFELSGAKRPRRRWKMEQSSQPFGLRLSEELCPSLPARESVADALMIVQSYGAWGLDLNDAHRRQIVLADEVKRMNGMSEALQAEWDRECGDTDTILHALGLDPANCRTDGGSLKVQMIVGALAHRDVMLKRDAEQPLRIAIAGAVPAMCSYAAKNPKHHFGEGLQDPCGVHAWLAEFGA